MKLKPKPVRNWSHSGHLELKSRAFVFVLRNVLKTSLRTRIGETPKKNFDLKQLNLKLLYQNILYYRFVSKTQFKLPFEVILIKSWLNNYKIVLPILNWRYFPHNLKQLKLVLIFFTVFPISVRWGRTFFYRNQFQPVTNLA